MKNAELSRVTARLEGIGKVVEGRAWSDPVAPSLVDQFNMALADSASKATDLSAFSVHAELGGTAGIDRELFRAHITGAIAYLKALEDEAQLLGEPEELKAAIVRGANIESLWSRIWNRLRRLFISMPARASSDSEESWHGIASEVFQRKRLLLSATEALRARHIPNAFKLATVDVFVEKAQKQLSDRAESYRVWGAASAVVALLLMVGAGVYISDGDLVKDLEKLNKANGWLMALVILKSSTVAGFFAGAVIFLTSVSRALLHEMVVLYQRRHALRFGRLFIYLHPENITVQELQEAFNWNVDYRSAFKDIHAEKIVQGGPAKILESAVELTTASVEAVKQFRNKEA